MTNTGVKKLVKLTPQQIVKLYELIGEVSPQDVTEKDISRVLVEMERRFTPYYPDKDKTNDINETNNKNILLVDDLEVSLYQLTKLLTKSNYNTYIARTSQEAKDIYKKHNFDYVFLDLFIPEPEDGFKLMEELKSFEQTTKNDTKIIIISGSDDKNHINECFTRGADDFIGKTEEWHIKILNKLRDFDEIKRGTNSGIKTTIEDEDNKIVSIKIKNIFKTGVVEELKREIVNLSLTGFNKLIFDLEDVTVESSEILNIIVYAYKFSNSQGGSLRLCSVNNSISDALSYIFLDKVIPIFTNKEAALKDFYERTSSKK